jgi:hypothetical protein
VLLAAAVLALAVPLVWEALETLLAGLCEVAAAEAPACAPVAAACALPL